MLMHLDKAAVGAAKLICTAAALAVNSVLFDNFIYKWPGWFAVIMYDEALIGYGHRNQCIKRLCYHIQMLTSLRESVS